MKASVCFRHDGVVRRLIFVNESKDGVYVGHLMCGANFHASYHTDGRRHFKDKGKLLGEPWSDRPIDEVKGITQVLHQSISLALPELSVQPPYEGDNGTETVVMLHDHLLEGEQRRFSLDVWLFDRASEPSYYEAVCGMRSDHLVKLADFVVSLEHFPNHKVALSFSARRP